MTYVERDCAIQHEGQSFTSGGAVVTDEYCIGYPKFDSEHVGARGDLLSWKGDKLGSVTITASWKTPRSYVSSTMFQMLAVVDGKRYTGRGAGSGMIFKGKRKVRV